MHLETLAPQTRRVLETLISKGACRPFYLAGGTALALQIGHRESIDLDFFSAPDFDRAVLKKTLSECGRYVLTNEEDGTLDGVLDDVKLTFLRYEYPLLFPSIPFNGVDVADMRDIACMKLDAASSRGSKKDFIDLFFLLERFSLEELIHFFETKYSHIGYNLMHILKSLTYFVEAENEPSPKMLLPMSWDEVKEKLASEAKRLSESSPVTASE